MEIENYHAKTNYKKIILGAFQIAVLFYPALTINDLLSIAISSSYALYPILIICSIFAGIAIYSDTKKEALLKWMFSIPINIFFMFFIWGNQFQLRALNWNDDYGDISAGGGFAMMLLIFGALITNSFAMLIGTLFSHEIKCDSLKHKIYITQKYILTIFCVILTLAIFFIDNIMPQYRPDRW